MKNTTTDKVRMFQLQYAGICEMCSELDEAQVEIQPQNDLSSRFKGPKGIFAHEQRCGCL